MRFMLLQAYGGIERDDALTRGSLVRMTSQRPTTPRSPACWR
jgi:hypothetical protein